MAMAAAAAVAVAFMLVVAMAFAVMVVVAVVAATVAAAAATRAAHHVEHSLLRVFRSLAWRDYFAAKVQGIAGKRVVAVHRNGVLLRFWHQALAAVAVGIDEGQHDAGLYDLFVETSVDAVHAFVEFHHVLLHVRAVSLLNR